MAILATFPVSFIFLLLTLSLPFSIEAQTDHNNVTLGSSLTAGNDAYTAFWGSDSGDFVFGFREIQKNNGLFLLAIWFQNVPNRTIVWSANGDKLVERGSKVELTEDGKLILINTKGEEIWSPKISTNAKASHAAMLDSGNFVLVSSDSLDQYLWESFDEPTDTILPSQTLSSGATLIARYKETNFSKGRFMLMLQPGGDLALATRFLAADSPDRIYWTSDIAGDGAQLVFNRSGSVYLARSNGSIAVMLSNNAPSMQDYYHRMILEYDGVFRRYVLPKSSNSLLEWSASTDFVPLNICKAVFGGMGVGACGLNSYCKFEGDRPSCHCPEGYSFLDPDDVREGCKRDFASQDCNKGASEADMFRFYEMANSDWIDADYENVTTNEEGCRQSCLVDCFCAAVVFQYPYCFKKRFPLPAGVVSSDIKWKSFVKIGKENSLANPKPSPGNSEKKRQLSLAVIVAVPTLLCGSVLLNFYITFFVIVRRRNYRERKMADQPAGMNLQCFSYEELTEATDGFKEKLGSGAAGVVYKGVLPTDGGIRNYVAVKRLNDMVTENEAEFKAEMNAIGRTNHRNVVQLLGFCNEGQHRLLVYEFMPNGSLADFLFGFGDVRLSWKERLRIALGTAKGLSYLHEDCSNLIIHCDIKPQNILLDESLTARISDFGLAKILKIDRTQTTTGIRGTRGYVAPEWFRHMPITPKVDVYSYGVLLLEIICSRKSFEADVEDPNEMVLADWAYDCYVSGKLNLLVTNDDDATGDMERLKIYVMIAIWCIQEDQSLRPTMKEVVQMLEGTHHVSNPPDPYS